MTATGSISEVIFINENSSAIITTPVSCVIAIVFSGDHNYNENAELHLTFTTLYTKYLLSLQNNLILIKVCQAIIRARYFPFVVT